MSVPINDLCVNAIELSSLPADVYVNTTEATDDPTEESLGGCGSGFGYNGVWYKFIVPQKWHRILYNNIDPLSLGQVVTVLGGNCASLSFIDCVSFGGYNTLDVNEGDVLYFLLTSYNSGGFINFHFSLERASPYGQVCCEVFCNSTPPVIGSGIYKLVPSKTNDTLYTIAPSTIDVKIP